MKKTRTFKYEISICNASVIDQDHDLSVMTFSIFTIKSLFLVVSDVIAVIWMRCGNRLSTFLVGSDCYWYIKLVICKMQLTVIWYSVI